MPDRHKLINTGRCPTPRFRVPKDPASSFTPPASTI